MPAFEWVHVQLHQQKGMISLSPPTICNSALQAILQPAKVGAMINNLQRAVVLERLTIEVEADDPDDSFLLAMALAGDADYLVTGDRRAGLLQRGHIERTRIVTPAVFCVEVL
ncbi:hypothetical protein FOT40_22565 [Pseudomonas aeruginosa]|nr:hypothetical protein FOT40_22565 [Pseudomonas aeruginosa]